MRAYQSSKLISKSNTLTLNKQNSRNWFKQFCEFLVKVLAQPYELKIEQIIDRKGNISWEVYDPTSQRTLWFYSEAEVRSWLDRRFSESFH